ncbi:MAG: hypothetical protein A2254_09210 [Ignavibacteria bacterium RIFOXYA2_FULL_35_9]|nr:MAG: hypothetical protein A2254_09210 [Ignavibacteria bacterium RIFOXYA2_FULL_35_9]
MTMAQNIDLAQNLYSNYEIYRETKLTHRRFKHADILSLINEVKRQGIFSVEKAGQSVEGRDIYLLSIGRGKSKVFLWSQMHGDEPTATMALFDVFNFFHANDGLHDIKKAILDNLTIYFMPMVNPDGAEVYQRRNIFEIDINRDVNRQQTPEGIILRKTFESLKPDFGFNLHDQSTRYSVSNSFKSAAISFLAPSLDHDRSVDSVRENSMKLIGELYRTLNHFVPGHIAKYGDDYEPRAFGDNFQKWGTSTILIETGGWKEDTEKQFLRKLNFITYISAFYSIASKSYKHESTKLYDQIPKNEQYLFDLILRNLKYKKDDKEIVIDVGINRTENNYNGANEFYFTSLAEDLGDLSVFFGYEDIDMNGFELQQGKTYPKEFTSMNEIKDLDFAKLYKEGFTSVILNSKGNSKPFTDLPINIKLKNDKRSTSNQKLLGSKANFIIRKDGEVHYAVINGFVVGVKSHFGMVFNALIQ